VGLTEAQARDQGFQFKTKHEDTSSWYSSRRVNATVSSYKVLVEEGSERILGAHLLGPYADEVINLFAMAMRFNLGTKGIKDMIYAYPTVASDIGYMV
jgi:glutathione reductase (NADPH)